MNQSSAENYENQMSQNGPTAADAGLLVIDLDGDAVNHETIGVNAASDVIVNADVEMLEAVEKPLVSENAQPTADAVITDLSTTATFTSAAQSPLH